MADPGSRYRSLSAAGLGAEAVGNIVSSTLRARSDLAVHELAPGRLSVSRTRRPTWAVVACACTAWLGGLGLLFLLVKQTEAGEVTVVDGPRGCTVTLPPLLDGPTAQAVEAALRTGRPGGDVPGEHATGAPLDDAADADDLEGRTVARRDVAPTPPASVAPARSAPRARVALRFEGATVTVEAGQPVRLGRDPSSAGDAVGHRVPGDATTVSKSHLLVDFDGTRVTVEDLGSTNGSTLTRAGSTRPLAPGDRTPVAAGDRVCLGAVGFVVDTAPDPAEVPGAWT